MTENDTLVAGQTDLTDDENLNADLDAAVQDPPVEGELVDAAGDPVVADEGTPTKRGGKATKTDVAKKAQPKKDAGLVDGVKPATKAQAEKLTEKLRKTLSSSIDTYLEAYGQRVWVNMGYPSWVDYLNGEFGDMRLRLPAAERLRVLPEMAKMPTRAVAAILGVDQSTIVTDRKKLKGEGDEDEDGVVVGEDGKEHKASDASKAAPRKTKPLADRFTDAIERLDRIVGDLTAMTSEEEWEDAAGEIATKHRADLKRYAAELDLIRSDKLPG